MSCWGPSAGCETQQQASIWCHSQTIVHAVAMVTQGAWQVWVVAILQQHAGACIHTADGNHVSCCHPVQSAPPAHTSGSPTAQTARSTDPPPLPTAATPSATTYPSSSQSCMLECAWTSVGSVTQHWSAHFAARAGPTRTAAMPLVMRRTRSSAAWAAVAQVSRRLLNACAVAVQDNLM